MSKKGLVLGISYPRWRGNRLRLATCLCLYLFPDGFILEFGVLICFRIGIMPITANLDLT